MLKSLIKDGNIVPDSIYNLDEAADSTQIPLERKSLLIIKAKMLIWWIWMVAKQCIKCYSVCQQLGDIYHHLYKGKYLCSTWTKSGPPGYCRYAVSPSRWMHDYVFENWFMEHFIPFIANDQKPVLVIYDGHGSHLMFKTVYVSSDGK